MKTKQRAAEFVDGQYSGNLAHLRIIYEAIIATALRLGDDVTVIPKKDYVMLNRTRQFAIVAPNGTKEIELILCLDDTQPGGRLEAVESHNTFLSNLIRIKSVAEVDSFVWKNLCRAYDQA